MQKLIHKRPQASRDQLISMDADYRAGLADYLIGGTARKILRQVDRPALAVEPDWFVAPVILGV